MSLTVLSAGRQLGKVSQIALFVLIFSRGLHGVCDDRHIRSYKGWQLGLHVECLIRPLLACVLLLTALRPTAGLNPYTLY